MSTIMEQLKADHGNVSHLLDTLDAQVAIVHEEGNAVSSSCTTSWCT